MAEPESNAPKPRSAAERSPAEVALGALVTGMGTFGIGALVSLIGDACHVSSGTTQYLWSGIPTLWRSAVWFPVVVGLAISAVSLSGRRLGLPSATRTRGQLATAILAVVAFYAFTATLRSHDPTVSVVLSGALALVIWRLWDPSWRCFALALTCSLLGPAGEIGVVSLGAVRYAADSNALFGVAPWLPCLYFAACAVASGLEKTLVGDSSS